MTTSHREKVMELFVVEKNLRHKGEAGEANDNANENLNANNEANILVPEGQIQRNSNNTMTQMELQANSTSTTTKATTKATTITMTKKSSTLAETKLKSNKGGKTEGNATAVVSLASGDGGVTDDDGATVTCSGGSSVSGSGVSGGGVASGATSSDCAPEDGVTAASSAVGLRPKSARRSTSIYKRYEN